MFDRITQLKQKLDRLRNNHAFWSGKFKNISQSDIPEGYSAILTTCKNLSIIINRMSLLCENSIFNDFCEDESHKSIKAIYFRIRNKGISVEEVFKDFFDYFYYYLTKNDTLNASTDWNNFFKDLTNYLNKILDGIHYIGVLNDICTFLNYVAEYSEDDFQLRTQVYHSRKNLDELKDINKEAKDDLKSIKQSRIQADLFTQNHNSKLIHQKAKEYKESSLFFLISYVIIGGFLALFAFINVIIVLFDFEVLRVGFLNINTSDIILFKLKDVDYLDKAVVLLPFYSIITSALFFLNRNYRINKHLYNVYSHKLMAFKLLFDFENSLLKTQADKSLWNELATYHYKTIFDIPEDGLVKDAIVKDEQSKTQLVDIDSIVKVIKDGASK